MHEMSLPRHCWLFVLTVSLLAVLAGKLGRPIDTATRSIAIGSRQQRLQSAWRSEWTFIFSYGARSVGRDGVLKVCSDRRKNIYLTRQASAGSARTAWRSNFRSRAPRAIGELPTPTLATGREPVAPETSRSCRFGRDAAVDGCPRLDGICSDVTAPGGNKDMESADVKVMAPWRHPNFALSSRVLDATTVAFVAGHTAQADGGSLEAWSLKAGGALGQKLWSAAALLDGRSPASRRIVTSRGVGTGHGAPFHFENLGVDERALLSCGDDLGTERVAWLRGDHSEEGRGFRIRGTLLGPIVGSQPLYVGAPAAAYRDVFPAGSAETNAMLANSAAAYSSFVKNHADRAATLYVGANDGMLHAFDARPRAVTKAAPGQELWAYVPVSVYARLVSLMQLGGAVAVPTVDGTPISADVFFGATDAANRNSEGWHTILVGSLGKGGRGIFAIDITHAPARDEAGLAKSVLWEFNETSPGAATLGYTIGTPSIGRLANGKWAVLLASGDFPGGDQAGPAYSSLFVLDAQSGGLLKEIRTPRGLISHGLSSPSLGDYQDDQVADVAFAGDSIGQLWRFDLSAANLASVDRTAGVSLLFKPLVAGQQPITTAPRLTADPASTCFMILFGTGSLRRAEEMFDDAPQALYGIRDTCGKALAAVEAPMLTAQAVTVDSLSGGIGVTGHAIPAAARGWYLPLSAVGQKAHTSPESGERVVIAPSLVASANSVVFSTLLRPADPSSSVAPKGSVIALNAANGSPARGIDIGRRVRFGGGYELAGARISDPASAGTLPALTAIGGGALYLPGQIPAAGGVPLSLGMPTSRRRAWQELVNEQ